MLTFLLVCHAIITAILVVVILMQRSEGGGLGMGGSPTGLMSARGAADFLTRATTILATLFVTLSIATAVVASRSGAPGKVDTSLQRTPAAAEAVPSPASDDPLAAVAGQIGNNAAPATVAPAPPPAASSPVRIESPAPKAATPAPGGRTPARQTRPETTGPAAAPPAVSTTLPATQTKGEATTAPSGPTSSN